MVAKTEQKHNQGADRGSGLALPDIPGTDAGAHLARRAVSLAFAIFGVMVGAGVLVGLFVEIDITVDAPGTIEPAVVQAVRSPASGVLVDVRFAPGDTVTSGAILARLEPHDASEQRTTLRSSIHGVVRKPAMPGSTGQVVERGEAVAEVASIDRWRADLIVGERDVGTVQIGDEAKVDVIALQSEKKDLIRGTVTSISPEPTMIQSDTTAIADHGAERGYRVTVQLDTKEMAATSDRQLRDGYSVTGKIITRRGRILPLVWRYLRRSA
ncbi:HlyD family efflux transporter periplasmic adaptor subunit [Longibacter salinarum]|uniref:HlyD family efflux transporter periplasmic adaptor subunit n=1 Tax=Longibacter salinarum TaxID=1850348 RepID=UPI0015CF3C30|nr:HlyD family secretion protein [Longibacter salinarum]